MDTIYCIDKYIYRIARKLRFRDSWFSYEDLILRYVRRSTSKLSLEKYSYPVSFKQGNIIWVFWAQGENNLPPILEKSLESIRKNCGQYDVVFLNMHNLSDYVFIPEFILEKVKKGAMSLTHFSDYLRFALLSKWGGFWVDITLFLVQPLPTFNALFTIKQEWLKEYISRGQWTGFFWYIPQNHPLSLFVLDYLTLYWRNNECIIDYFLVDYVIRVFYERNSSFAKEIDSIKYNNPDLYFFQSKECEEPFEKDKWQEICTNTSIFKLSWRNERVKKKGEAMTYYGLLFNIFNSK